MLDSLLLLIRKLMSKKLWVNFTDILERCTELARRILYEELYIPVHSVINNKKRLQKCT